MEQFYKHYLDQLESEHQEEFMNTIQPFLAKIKKGITINEQKGIDFEISNVFDEITRKYEYGERESEWYEE